MASRLDAMTPDPARQNARSLSPRLPAEVYQSVNTYAAADLIESVETGVNDATRRCKRATHGFQAGARHHNVDNTPVYCGGSKSHEFFQPPTPSQRLDSLPEDSVGQYRRDHARIMHGRDDIAERGGGEHLRRRADHQIFHDFAQGSGSRLVTFRGGAAHFAQPQESYAFKARAHFVVVSLAQSPRTSASPCDQSPFEFEADAGMISICPAGGEGQTVCPSTVEDMIVALTPESLLELAALEFGSGVLPEIQRPAFGTVDPMALQLSQLLKVELTRRDTPNEFYVDALITMFGVHILRTYAKGREVRQWPQGGLSNRSARKVQEFLDVNFARKTTVADLAAICGLSPSYFIQAFSKTFGEPPHRYVLRLRLDFAEKLLAESDLSIVEIAHLSGFSDQSHLTATMSKYRSKTPKQVKLQR